MDKVTFVGHDINSKGITMTEPRIASAIAFAKPSTLKELMYFLGQVHYFRDHIKGHSDIAHHLHDMVSTLIKRLRKRPRGQRTGSDRLRSVKIWWMDVQDFTSLTRRSTRQYCTQTRRIMPTKHTNVRWYQRRRKRKEHEELVRFLSGAFHGAQTRWSTIEKEAFAIYWAANSTKAWYQGIYIYRAVQHAKRWSHNTRLWGQHASTYRL